MENLEIKNIAYLGGETRFVAYQNEKPCGYLSYNIADKYVWIIHIKSYSEKHQIGKHLLNSFVDFLPDKTQVRANISHLPTVRVLKEKDLLKLPESGIRRLKSSSILSDLPIVRFLDRGRIATLNIEISSDDSIKGSPYLILLRGIIQK